MNCELTLGFPGLGWQIRGLEIEIESEKDKPRPDSSLSRFLFNILKDNDLLQN